MKTRLIILGLVIASAAASHAQTWDLKNDFSFTNNPNGAWQYGRYDGAGNFFVNTAPTTFFGFGTGWDGLGGSGRPFVGVNTSGSGSSGALAGQVFVHPDFVSNPTSSAGIHWVSPTSQTIHVSGTFYQGDTNSVSEFITLNRTTSVDSRIDQFLDFNFSFDISVAGGDFLDFYVGTNTASNPNSATTPIDIHITASTVPEPASFAVLGLGAVALVRRKKRS